MSLNIGDQHECYGRINSFYFTCGTRRVEHIKNLVISHIQIGDKWWTRRNEKNVTTTNNQCSSLNADLFRINITKDPKCQCGAPFEDSIHNLMECPLYQNERDCIFIRETLKNIETLLFGSDEININENSMIFNKVRAYIRQTKRF